jgi:hypothetical protein
VYFMHATGPISAHRFWELSVSGILAPRVGLVSAWRRVGYVPLRCPVRAELGQQVLVQSGAKKHPAHAMGRVSRTLSVWCAPAVLHTLAVPSALLAVSYDPPA